MSVEKNYAGLGLFIAIALVVILGTAVLFIQRLRRQDAIEFVTYTTEDVTGLDISSPVRYLGVSVGRVTGIRVDPRAATVEIDFEVYTERLTELGVMPAPPPGIELGFTPSRPYIPSMPSALTTAESQLPAFLARAAGTLQTLREIIAKLPASLNRSDQFFSDMERIMQESQLPAFSADSRQFFTTTSAQIDRMTSELDGLIGKEGTLVKFTEETQAALRAADLPATTKATRQAASDSELAADDLRRTLPAIRDSLEQMRELARQLEEQPESVVYGPRPAKQHP